jgi:hypothetical protein
MRKFGLTLTEVEVFSGLPDPDRRVGHYPRRVRWPAGCIMIAATLRQTAAPVANVKSEIHMA